LWKVEIVEIKKNEVLYSYILLALAVGLADTFPTRSDVFPENLSVI
jgi:hypothetical protein